MVISVLGVILMLLLMGGLLPAGGGLGMVIFSVVILYLIVVFRIGKGMRAGERQAIYGFCLVCLIDVAFRVFRFGDTHNTKYLWYLAISLGLFYVPPLVSAFRHWLAFK
jgi:multisubunit Na+/H+ antiporter MnhB subunit